MPVTVVFDTNILFSATGWRGNPFRCVELARSGQIRAVTCPEILRELAEKLSAKLAFSDRQVDETLADYLSFHTLVEKVWPRQVALSRMPAERYSCRDRRASCAKLSPTVCLSVR
jgi:predicted nucleic acid-binding protein